MSFAATDQRDDQLEGASGPGRSTGLTRYTAPLGVRVRRFGSRVRPGPVIAVALVLAGLQLIIRTGWAASGWWTNDDFTYINVVLTTPLDLDLLFRTYNDHIQPGTWLTTWVISHLAPWDWRLAVVAELLFQLIADVAVLALLRRLFGARPAILGPYAIFLFSALTTSSFVWYAAAIQWMPLTAAVAGSLYYFTGYLSTGRARHLVYTGLAVLGGLFFIEKALLIPGLLALFAMLYGVDGRWWRRPVLAVRRYRPAFALFLGIGIGYVALWSALVQPSWKRSATPWEAVEIVYKTIFTTFIPQLWGGPWRWVDLIGGPTTANTNANAWGAPPQLGTWLTWEITAAVILISVWLSRRAWRAWVLLGVFVLADAALLAVARIWPFGTATALDNRYVAELSALAAVVLCLAFLPNVLEGREPEAPAGSSRSSALRWVAEHRTVVAAVVLVLVNALTISGLYSGSGYVDGWKNPRARQYFDTLRAELRANPGRVDMFDQTVPDHVVTPLIYPANTLSRLLTAVPDRPRFVTVTEHPIVPNNEGRLHTADVQGVGSRPGRVPGCGWFAQAAGTEIPLDKPVYTWFWIVKLNYLAEADTTATIHLGGFSRTLQLRRGPNTVYLKADTAGGKSVRLEGLDPGVSVCVDSVVVGGLAPQQPLKAR